MGTHPQALKQTDTADVSTSGALGFSDLMCGTQGFDDDGDNSAVATVLGRKIVVSVHSGKGKCKTTKIEGIPAQHSLEKLLKKLKNMHSCGGHVAAEASGAKFLVLQGQFSAEVTSFLLKEGLADSDGIVHHG